MQNNPAAPYQRVNIMDRGESFNTRAKLIACVHGAMKGGDDYATLLAIKFTFSPMKRRRRARLAMIMLQFMSDGTGLEVVDLAPSGAYRLDANRSSERSYEARIGGVLGPTEIGAVITHETRTESMGQVVGRTRCNTSGTPNVAQWTIQENEETKTGIPASLTVVILLKRSDQDLFSMMPKVDVRVSGFDFEEALAGRQPKDDPVVFNPISTFPVWDLPFNLTDIDQRNLEEFWYSHSPKIVDIQLMTPAVLPHSDLPRDGRVTATDGQQPTEVGVAQSLEETMIPTQSHGSLGRFGDDDSNVVQPELQRAIEKAFYTELWNVNAEECVPLERLRLSWKDLGDAPDDIKLSEKFSWLKNELEIPDLPDIEREQQKVQTNLTQDNSGETQRFLIEISEAMHTMCSLLTCKAKRQKSFKSFQDLGLELFDEKTIDSIAEFFELERKDYNGFRKLDFGSCEFLSTGKGRELSIFYIIQTPYYSSGFWSMFLVGKADPEDPDRSRKLSGLIQSGADVDLEEILNATMSKAKDFGYHPLLPPYHLYINHYESTSEQFDSVRKKVEKVESRIMHELQSKNELTDQARSEANGDDSLVPSHWGLAKLSKSLHEASMDIGEVARRRQFEDDLSRALKDELGRKRPAQNKMFRDLNRYDRWAKAHQLDIEGMPDRIDSLKNLLYSMIAQQDNVVSIRLAREGLSDSKAMKTLSFITILFLPGTFVATLFTTNLVSFQDSAAETRAYVKVVVPLTIVLLILYGLWLWKAPSWSRARRRMRDPEEGNMRVFHKSSHSTFKTDKQS